MFGPVDRREVADIEPVDKGKIHLGISDVQVSLEIAGVFHRQDYIFFRQMVLAEYVQAVFLEVSVES